MTSYSETANFSFGTTTNIGGPSNAVNLLRGLQHGIISPKGIYRRK